MEAEPKWGILYFTYDWFSAIRTDLVREVQYDTFITVYMSDCDFYPRARAAGWSTLQYSDHCPGISPRVRPQLPQKSLMFSLEVWAQVAMHLTVSAMTERPLPGQ